MNTHHISCSLFPENTAAFRRWRLAYTLIRNPGLVQYRVQGKPNPPPPPQSLDIDDIGIYQDPATSTHLIDDNVAMDTWSCVCRCFNKFTCVIPPNIITNIMAGIVVTAIVLLFFGLPIVLGRLQTVVDGSLAAL